MRNNEILHHRKMPLVERHENKLMCYRSRCDQCIRQPRSVALAIVAPIQASCDSDGVVERDDAKSAYERIQLRSFLPITNTCIQFSDCNDREEKRGALAVDIVDSFISFPQIIDKNIRVNQ